MIDPRGSGNTQRMRLPPLTVPLALGLAACEPGMDPTDSNADSSGTDTDDGETETGEPAEPPPRPTEPSCDAPAVCGSWTGEGGEEPSSQLHCHYEVLRDADEPAHLKVSTQSDEPDVPSPLRYEFLIDGTSRWVTFVTSHVTNGQVNWTTTEICELQPSEYFEDCLHGGCWASSWVQDCVDAGNCE